MPEDREILEGIQAISPIPEDESDSSSHYYDLNTLIAGMAPRNNLIPPYWSQARDDFFRKTALNSGPFLIALYNLITKVTAIEPSMKPIEAQSKADKSAEAARLSALLLKQSWAREIPAFLFDLGTQDKGAFLEVVGGGEVDGPIEPTQVAPGVFLPGLGLKHRDAARCRLTGNSEFPVVYSHTDGIDYKLHNTRVVHYAQMPHPNPNLKGVGVSPMSRVIDHLVQYMNAEEIVTDMLVDGYIGELIFTKPFTSDQIKKAFRVAEAQMTEGAPGTGHRRRHIFVGVENFNDDIQIERIPLRRLPDNYSKQEAMVLFSWALAAAFSMDARELLPGSVSGETRADAQVQDQKSRQKFTREWINIMSMELDSKFAPMTVCTSFDFRDEVEIQEKATARKTMGEALKLEIEMEIITPKIAASQLNDRGFISDEELEQIIKVIEERESQQAPSIPASSPPTPQQVAGLFNRSTQLMDKAEEDDYREILENLLADFEEGIISEQELTDNVLQATEVYTMALFLAGANRSITDLTPADLQALNTQYEINNSSIDNLIIAAVAGVGVNASLGLWVNSLGRIREVGKLFQIGDPVLRWVLGKADHCDTCVSLNGTEMRKSEWLAMGLYPRCIGCGLKCGGYSCACSFRQI